MIARLGAAFVHLFTASDAVLACAVASSFPSPLWVQMFSRLDGVLFDQHRPFARLGRAGARALMGG
jgi:hypothetical protein